MIDLVSKHGVLPGGKIKTFAYSAQKHDQSTRQTIPFVGPVSCRITLHKIARNLHILLATPAPQAVAVLDHFPRDFLAFVLECSHKHIGRRGLKQALGRGNNCELAGRFGHIDRFVLIRYRRFLQGFGICMAVIEKFIFHQGMLVGYQLRPRTLPFQTGKQVRFDHFPITPS